MTTYYVDPVSGNNSNAGTSIGTAWATTAKAASIVAAGDVVKLLATSAEMLTGTNTIAFATAGSNSPTGMITWIGCDASGNPLSGSSYYTIDGSGMTAANDISTLNVGYNLFQGIYWKDARRGSIVSTSSDPGSTSQFVRCRFAGAVSYHMGGNVSSGFGVICTNCKFENAPLCFVQVGNTRAGPATFGCTFNSLTTVYSTGNNGTYHINDVYFGNGTVFAGMQFNSAEVIKNCTFYNNTTCVILRNAATTGRWMHLHGCAFVNNGTAIKANSDSANISQIFSDENFFYGQTTADLTGGCYYGPGDLNAGIAPLFNDPSNNDFRLQTGSPLIGAMINGANIGAMGQMPAAGGFKGNDFTGGFPS